MTIQEIAMQLWPFWLLGLMMIITVLCSEHRDLLTVKFKGVLYFLRVMILVSVYRYVIFRFIAPASTLAGAKSMVGFIPWQATFGVFWEDAVYVLPLVILARLYSDKTWYKYVKWPLLILTMISFGSGHMYQGVLASIGLCFCIPFSKKMGMKYGFGTVMACHILYDMITILTLGWIVGA